MNTYTTSDMQGVLTIFKKTLLNLNYNQGERLEKIKEITNELISLCEGDKE